MPLRLRADMRGGYALVELLAGVTLTSVLGGVLLGLLVAQLRLTRVAAQRALAADALRTAATVLAGEVRRASRRDVRTVAPDSLVLRSFRGTGIICSISAGNVRVRYRGDRLPDARKDSVVLLPLPRPDTRAVPLLAVRPAPTAACITQSGETLLELGVPMTEGSEAVVLVFESGVYYLTARALRFRLGAEGRQPLTSETFAPAHTRFLGAAPQSLGFALARDGGGVRVFSAAFASP